MTLEQYSSPTASTHDQVRPAPGSALTAQGSRLSRFTHTERAAHWVQAITFLILLASGFALALPSIESLFGHRALLREIHLSAFFFFFFGPALIALSGDRKSIARDVEAVDTWDSDDLRWLIPFPILRVFGVSTPPQGRFNAGQKLNSIFVVWCTVTFTVTGILLWQNRRFPSDVVNQANSIHTALAYVALVAFLGHFYLATLDPKTRHSFRAMTQGWVNRDWALEHHVKWVKQLTPAAPPPAYDALRTTLQLILGSAAALFAVRVFFFWLGANVTDKVTERLYNITAWPGVASIQPQTGVRIADWPALAYLVLCILAWFVIDQARKLLPGTDEPV
jgi:formate dehydrogenase subunit gamma